MPTKSCSIRDIDFSAYESTLGNGILPVIVYDIEHREVVMQAFANYLALETTLTPLKDIDVGIGPVRVFMEDKSQDERNAIWENWEEALKEVGKGHIGTYWSTSRPKNKDDVVEFGELWPKGVISGDWHEVRGVYTREARDALLYEIDTHGHNVCHERTPTCFNKLLSGKPMSDLMSAQDLTKVDVDDIDFDSLARKMPHMAGLVPVICYEYDQKHAPALRYADKDTVKEMIDTNLTRFTRINQKTLSKNGSEPYRGIIIYSIRTDCDQDVLLVTIAGTNIESEFDHLVE